MTKNHYQAFKDYLPPQYRKMIQKETGASISLIDKVIRGFMVDNKGILLSFYRIVNEHISKLEKTNSELEKLKEKIKKYQAA